MATLVKEKRREKKKSKEKHVSQKELPSLNQETESTSAYTETIASHIVSNEETGLIIRQTEQAGESIKTEQSIMNEDDANVGEKKHIEQNSGIKETSAPVINVEEAQENTGTIIQQAVRDTQGMPAIEENLIPSAPGLEQVHTAIITKTTKDHVTVETVKPKVQCMPLEEAIWVYGGKEIAEVKAMSEREEALVEAGPFSGADHPLVDLLSTFRLSLSAVERERVQLSCNLIEEEKSRLKLWRIEQRSVSVTQACACGADVQLRAVFERAELLKERLPAARMRLQALLNDVQESYCYHQHAALLAHCQIEDLITETVESNKGAIREALSLVLQALRLSDGTVEAYSQALQRWAATLAGALVDERDLGQLLFLLHHLFRQTRSVRWAARMMRLGASDSVSAARAVAVLNLLLARPGLEPALECTEEASLEAWEEMDVRGGAGAVEEGRLRERDLLALLAAFPLRALLARLTLFPRADITAGSPLEWGDASGGHGVRKACCGVRALLDVCARALRAHPAYARLHERLRTLAAKLLHSLAALHLHSSPLYNPGLVWAVRAELQACFVAGLALGGDAAALPAALLDDDSAWDYCLTIIVGMHDTTPRHIDALGVEVPEQACDVRVRVVAQAAVDRAHDHDLARSVREFLFKIGLKRRAACGGRCAAAARAQLPRLLAAHPYLHTTAFAMLADFNQAEPVDPTFISCLSPAQWRPNPMEMRSVLDDWARRCPQLAPQLLPLLAYTPHQGLSLETQLSLGWWLCEQRAGGEQEWRWAALRRLRVHRAPWGLPLDAPPPAPHDPADLFAAAHALLSSDWGHCIPMACGAGAEALCRLAAARPADALHCAAPLMRLLAQSPESVSYTPKFAETFTLILNAGPSLVQRALGRARLSGADQLQRLVIEQLSGERSPEAQSALLSAWLHALWKPALPGASRAILDAAVRACGQWATLDAHVAALLQEENGKEYVTDAVRHAATAPLLCEAALRGAHAAEVRSNAHALLAAALWRQRASGQRIHVDNALKEIGAFMLADELAGLRAAGAVLAAPPGHPAQLQLWRLLLHVYLQRPPAAQQDTTPPIGPLLYSGIVKSRLLSQLKRRLQESIAYHQKQAETLKANPKGDRPPERPQRREKISPVVDSGVFPSLSIADLTGGGTGDSSSESEAEDGPADASEVGGGNQADSQDTFHMICYHSAAEKLLVKYAQWLDEGEKTLAAPHHADPARFIPQQALDTAWRLSVPRPPPDTPTTPPAPCQPALEAVANVHALSHYDRAVQTLLSVKDNSHRRPRRRVGVSPLSGVNFGDSRAVLAAVDQLLADMQKLAQDWRSEVRYISRLDGQLWELVGALRVRRPLPPVAKACPQGCMPTTVRIPEEEWCISTGAERGIKDNRRSAHTALQRLARARPHAARTAAALHCLARRIRNAEGAVRVAERAARCADDVHACVLARQAITTLVADLAERWICQDGSQCAALVRAWSGAGAGEARHALVGALVAPRRLPRAHWPPLYTALLAAALPPHAAFSHLSKFEMSLWAERAEAGPRREVLGALLAAARRLGPAPGDHHQVLLELLGVHLYAVMTPDCVRPCARAVAEPGMPLAFCAAIARAVDALVTSLHFDELGHLQRELGAQWWEARAAGASLAPYAEHAASVLRSLQRAFVAAAVALSYEPAVVVWYAWGAARESWGAWVTPHAAPPLLPSTGDGERYTAMLARFLDTLHQIMDQCPGSEESLLRQVWEWAVGVCMSVYGARAPQEGRVQASALLAALERLPWQHQWWHVDCLQLALQAVSSGERELCAWCAGAWRGVRAQTWLRGAAEDAPACALAALLALFTAPDAPHHPQTLEEACALPWARLPCAALDEALDRFYAHHYSAAAPYHDHPQFVVVLAASELRAGPQGVSTTAASREKRASGVSRWVRAAAAPELHAHVRAHAASVLAVIEGLAPQLERAAGELEELLSRALVIMCMEAAPAALPVWEQWVRRCARRERAACASAVATLTAVDYFAALAEAVAKAQLADKESSGWAELRARWATCAWAEGGALAARARPHAAYGALLARAHSDQQLCALFHALANNIVSFNDNEAIVAVWICVACRYSRTAGGECAAGARALLARWGAEPRRTLLQVVALQAAPGPAPQHRLLCKLAQCVLAQDEASVRAYEAACGALLAGDAEAAGWGRAPRAARLPRLAARLYPRCELFFREELRLADDEP